MSNSALEQAASAARPWQRAPRRQSRSGQPRPVTRPSLLAASVTKATGVLSWNADVRSVPVRCAEVQTTALAAPKERAT